jgi:alpha-L-rhamnosidase
MSMQRSCFLSKKLLLSLFAFIVFRAQLFSQASIIPVGLRCEYLVNPQGIDEPAPRLSWTLRASDSSKYGQRQQAYRIVVGSSPEKLKRDEADIWNSGWVRSDQMQQVIYKGQPLISDRHYYWKIAVRDEKGKESGWSEVANWSTGIFKRAEWTAQWIGTGDSLDPKARDCNIDDPWFVKTVELREQPSRAILFLASVGYHELYINGKKIGNHVLAPAVSDHSKRARYIAYDIAAELKPGNNSIGVWLGVSWSIFSSYATDDKPRTPLFIAQADVYYAEKDVAALRIVSDKSWKTHPSPNRLLGNWSFGNMGGELWDAGKEMNNWNDVSANRDEWKNATQYRPRLSLSAQMVELNIATQEIHAVAIEKKSDSVYRVDMGVNFAGFTSIKLRGKPGQKIDLLFSEREKDEMTFRNYSAIIPGATGEAVFHNRFNYSSGRWITIRGVTQAPLLDDIRGWVVRTDYQPAADFQCSDSLQNWIYQKVRWNFENLSLGGYVVDCPQRERLGYGGDAHATSETGMFNYKLGAFYTKWMEDWRDVQGTRALDVLNYGGNADVGILPHTAPTYQGGGGPAWGGIVVTLPWQIYLHEEDKRILEKNFETITRWLAFLESHTQRDHLMVRFGGVWDFLGDWLWPGATAEGMNNDKPENICFNNAYRVYNLRTAAKIAMVLGRTAEAKAWIQTADEASRAIHAKYFNKSDHSYADSSMRNLAAVLLAEAVPGNLRARVWKRLEQEILITQRGHIDAGITAGALLFKLLREEGRNDLIYAMTSQTDYPGWGYMRANGATSLWEMWEKDLRGHSLLHSSYLYPGAWYIEGVAGIRRDERRPGFQQFIIRPPLLNATPLTWARATYDAPAGQITVSWKKEKNGFNLQIVVPPNTKATVYFPAGSKFGVKVSSSLAKKIRDEKGYAVYEIPAGHYTFSESK